MTLLSVSDLEVQFKLPGTAQALRAVDGVSFEIGRGEVFGLSLIHISEPTRPY